MTALGLAVAATALFATALVGVRLLRTTGLEQVEESLRVPVAQEDVREKGLGPMLDALGRAFLGAALRLYGPARLKRLDQAIRQAGRPDGLTVTTYVRRQAGFVVLAIGALVLFGLLGQPLFGVVFALVFVLWMRLWLQSVAARRQARIDADLPD